MHMGQKCGNHLVFFFKTSFGLFSITFPDIPATRPRTIWNSYSVTLYEFSGSVSSQELTSGLCYAYNWSINSCILSTSSVKASFTLSYLTTPGRHASTRSTTIRPSLSAGSLKPVNRLDFPAAANCTHGRSHRLVIDASRQLSREASIRQKELLMIITLGKDGMI